MMLLLAGSGLVLAAGLVGGGAGRRRADIAYHLLFVGGCAIAAIDAVRVLATGSSIALTVPASLPGGDWELGIDALSAVFLLGVLVVGAASAHFGRGDLARQDAARSRSSVFAQFVFSTLVVAMAMVVVARQVVVFLGAWEIMAISSYLLIVVHHEERDVRRAGLIYLVATHTATLGLFAMFAVWTTAAPDWSFAALAAASPALGLPAVAGILLLSLLGFGVKAGCVPLHFWLPPAHAAAPSHVSALMSGVVIKTGIYGLLRVLLLLGGAPAWWGWLVFGIGIASGVLGVLWALAQHDVKRLLAYHSVENIGIIFMGIGIGVLGVAHGQAAIAVLGFAGALLHTVNHALFKSLLFLAFGAVYRATGTRNMEELGGIARLMPFTWIGFVVGAAAIIGVPPFNGFVSEWLVFQGMFHAADAGASLRLALLGMPALALIGGLALACFAKVSGIVFLGTPRSAAAAAATESSGGAYVTVLALAACCVGLGVFPRLGLALVTETARALSRLPDSDIPDAVRSAAWMITLLALGSMAVALLVWWLRSALMRRADVRHEATWACGFDAVTPRMQYTASSFAAPLLSIFGRLSGVRVERGPRVLRTHPMDLVLDGVALPLWAVFHRAALRIRVTQQGRLHMYLLYVMAALLVMLAYLSFGPR